MPTRSVITCNEPFRKIFKPLNRGNVQNSLAKELYIVSYTTFETIKETSISSFRNSRSILELESKRLAG